MIDLPPADPLLVADTVAALPARLRAKLDAAVAQAGQWEVEDGQVRLPGGTVVILAPSDGALRTPEQVSCGCLLSPACLHRASVLAAAPVYEPEPATEPVRDDESPADPERPADAGGPADPEGPADRGAPHTWRPAEHRAAAAVATAAAAVLEAGLPGAGAAVQAELLRALHHARLEGLHRLAASATSVVTAIRAGRADDASFRLPDLTGDLVDVLETAAMITTGRGDPAAWRGQARTGYEPVGTLRLTGLCLEAVVTESGYAGVVVWLTDGTGRLWSVSDVRPGGPDRVRAAAHGPAAIGETGLTHRSLTRAGMLLTGATANPEGRLGAGRNVRAVSAAGTPWSEPPLRDRFGPSGPGGPGPLTLLDITLCGGSPGGALDAVDPTGAAVRLVAPPTSTEVMRLNLRLLAGAPGLHILAVARRRATRSGAAAAGPLQLRVVELIAVGGPDLDLPEEYSGHADLALDRLSPTFLRPSGPPPPFPGAVETPDPLAGLTRRHERVVAGGRLTLTAPGVEGGVRAETAALRRSQLPTGAGLLEALVAAGRPGDRDVFGRLVTPDADVLARHWLAAGVYLRAVGERLTP